MQWFLLICIFISAFWLLILLKMQRFLLIYIFLSASWSLILLEIRWFQLYLLILSVSRIQHSFNMLVTASALFFYSCGRWGALVLWTRLHSSSADRNAEDGVRWKKKKVRWTFFPPNRPSRQARLNPWVQFTPPVRNNKKGYRPKPISFLLFCNAEDGT